MSGATQDDGITLPSQLGRLASLIEKKPESFATGDEDIRDAALFAAKYVFDLSKFNSSYDIDYA